MKMLDEIGTSKNFDTESKVKANGLFTKIRTFDFIVALMFMKNVMKHTRYMVDVL